MDVVTAVADLEHKPALHASRLLVLLVTLLDRSTSESVEGLTKLAKLDFLLRYPVLLERALIAKGKSTREVGLEEHERHSVESQMVRYRFGPWDHRYREFLNILIAKGLITVSIDGRKVVIALTAAGRDIGGRLAADPRFDAYARRAKLLRTHFDQTGANLVRFIYDTFPEILTLRSNTLIQG